MRLSSLILSLSLFVSIGLSAQVIPNANAVEAYRNAEEALLDGKAQQALRWFEKSLAQQPNLSAARRGMAICYELLREYPKAAEQYEIILDRDSLFSRIMYFQAGEAFFKSGEPDKALNYFTTFKEWHEFGDSIVFSMNTERELEIEQGYLKKIDSNIRACEVSLDSVKFINITEVINLGKNINTKVDDYFPFLTNDQKTLYFTRKTENGDEDLFQSKGDATNWTRATSLRQLNSVNDEGMSTMVRDGRLMFFTACGREGVLGPCDIWQATFDDRGNPIEVSPLEGFANSEKWESQAAISCDGTTLFFASKRDGGFGGTDLWTSSLQEDGKWSMPTNLGPKINTELDEEAPFITNDDQVLYFSSNGHPGMGDQDIFMSWKDPEETWSQPINLGPPVNSPFRELGFFLTADGLTGYFASDRSDISEAVGGLDIYKFKLNEQLYSTPITFVEGVVLDSVLDFPVQATVEFAHRPSITTGSDGRFFLCIPAWDTLYLSVEKPYFEPFSAPYIIPDWSNKQYYTIELRLRSSFDLPKVEDPKLDTITEPEPKLMPVVHTHITYFNFDETKLAPDEEITLIKFIQSLNDKPAERIDIIGFSDEIGTDLYNLRLSEERAKRIAQIIQENDMSVNHIYMEGRGKMSGDLPDEKKRKVEIRITVLE